MHIIISFTSLFAWLFSFPSCRQDEYNHEKFYGVVKYSEECDRLVVYIPEFGEVDIPENEGCCDCSDGHEEIEEHTYQLKAGDYIAINFKYEKSWDENSVKVMESYPAKFDRKAGLIEVLRKNIAFDKTDNGYELSFPITTEIAAAKVGDTLYFVEHDGYNGFASMSLFAEGTVLDISNDIVTVRLNSFEKENEFLDKYCLMSVELTWMQ